MTDNIEITTDKDCLDINFITEFITNTHWAKERSVQSMKTCIDNSLNFGVYINKKQIGYARLVTDYSEFVYIMDLFVDKTYRGNGYSKELIRYILEYDKLKTIKVWRLATSNAHGLYKKFGFQKVEEPQNLMELKK